MNDMTGQVAPDPTVRVLLVCMGNICRSPLAEGVLRHRLAQLSPELPVLVDSAGTHAYHAGSLPDDRALAAAKRRGIDISMQRARLVNPGDFVAFDLILAMDEENHALLVERAAAEYHGKIRLFLDFAPGGGRRSVPDPYYGGTTGFERVLDMLEEGTAGVLAELERLVAGRLGTPGG